MKKILKKKFLTFIFGPVLILPVMFILIPVFGSYSGEEIGHLQKIPLILQGGTDWGGSNMFAVIVASYFTFGFMACIYLNLKLWSLDPGEISFQKSLLSLKVYFYFFLLEGLVTMKNSPPPNDEKNIFFFSLMLYSLTILFITFLNKKQFFRKSIRLIISPVFIYLWILMGWNGITSKAGQIVNAGVVPEYKPLSYGHSLMLQWHYFCDNYIILPENNFFPILSLYLLLFGVFFLFYSLLKKIRAPFKDKFNGLIYKYFWKVLITLFLIFLITISCIKFYQFQNIKITAIEIADTLKDKFLPENISFIKTEAFTQNKGMDFFKNQGALNPEFFKIIDNLFNPIAPMNNFDIKILIPLKNDFFLYINENSSYRYADVRKLKEKYSKIIDYEIIKEMLDGKKDYISNFLSMEISNPLQIFPLKVFCGKIISDEAYSPLALILISHEMPRKKHLVERRCINPKNENKK